MADATIKPGSFCISVLRTRDMRRALAFYEALIGWTSEAVADTRYSFLQWRRRTVAAVHEISQDPDASEVWVPHVLVENLADVSEQAVALGAIVVDHADVTGVAQMATIQDTEGALFGLWQPAPHRGAQLMEETGSLWWVEILSNEVSRTRDFYTAVFGWTCRETSFEPFESYTVFERAGTQEGGILPIGRGWEVSPRWNSIFAVEDCDAITAHAEQLGGRTIFVHTVPKAGRIASFSDPAGAVLVIRGPVPEGPVW